MKVAVVKETYPGENRVSLVPSLIPKLTKAGVDVVVETGAGAAAGYSDAEYVEKGASIVANRSEAFAADVVFLVRMLGSDLENMPGDLAMVRDGQVIVGSCDPLGSAEHIATAAKSPAAFFALEMIPRITRAQSMDVLSSMATIAGYRAVLLAATELPKMCPMMMTAAGTLKPAKAFVIGAGVAGLQAIATARRLGAVVSAYDVRPAVREQVESLGASFVEMELETDAAEDKGGYAKALGEEFYKKQRELMAAVVAESDIVISTAAIPGRQSPLLITGDAVAGMQAGSVIVDLAAERGGNCELSQADKRVVEHGVTILGPTNLPAEIPYHASQMYANNITRFLLEMVKDGELTIDMENEVVAGTLVARDGEVTHPRIRDILGLPALEKPEPEAPPEPPADSEAK